jgi:hypothetical protein
MENTRKSMTEILKLLMALIDCLKEENNKNNRESKLRKPELIVITKKEYEELLQIKNDYSFLRERTLLSDECEEESNDLSNMRIFNPKETKELLMSILNTMGVPYIEDYNEDYKEIRRKEISVLMESPQDILKTVNHPTSTLSKPEKLSDSEMVIRKKMIENGVFPINPDKDSEFIAEVTTTEDEKTYIKGYHSLLPEVSTFLDITNYTLEDLIKSNYKELIKDNLYAYYKSLYNSGLSISEY